MYYFKNWKEFQRLASFVSQIIKNLQIFVGVFRLRQHASKIDMQYTSLKLKASFIQSLPRGSQWILLGESCLDFFRQKIPLQEIKQIRNPVDCMYIVRCKVFHRSNHMYELKHFGMVWQRRTWRKVLRGSQRASFLVFLQLKGLVKYDRPNSWT